MQILINADDYGWNESCSKAILEAFDKGLITTTTMMSTGEYFDEAAETVLESKHRDKVGIHLDLTEGRPLTQRMQKEPFFCNENGDFHNHVNRYKKLSSMQKEAVYQELSAQIEHFEKTGLKCHHIDSHHHIHTAPNILPIVLRLMKEHNIEYVRIHRNVGNIPAQKKVLKNIFNLRLQIKHIAYTKFFGGYADYINTNGKYKVSESAEIMCHPDFNLVGELIDRNSNAPYESPYGKNLEALHYALIKHMEARIEHE